jgi:hypothetical protein
MSTVSDAAVYYLLLDHLKGQVHEIDNQKLGQKWCAPTTKAYSPIFAIMNYPMTKVDWLAAGVLPQAAKDWPMIKYAGGVKTCRDPYLCLDLSMHVHKNPFHLVTQSL